MAQGRQAEALEREVGAQADLLMLRGGELLLREAAQAAGIPERPRSRTPSPRSGEGLAQRA
eukprot:10102712-Alexandrium_andersonii.AAC.1